MRGGGCAGCPGLRCRLEVSAVPQAYSPATVHPDDVLTGPVGIHDCTDAIPMSRGGVLDSDLLADADGGETVGGSVMSGLHALHVAGYVSFPMPKVVTPVPADEVMASEGGHTVPQLLSG